MRILRWFAQCWSAQSTQGRNWQRPRTSWVISHRVMLFAAASADWNTSFKLLPAGRSCFRKVPQLITQQVLRAAALPMCNTCAAEARHTEDEHSSSQPFLLDTGTLDDCWLEFWKLRADGLLEVPRNGPVLSLPIGTMASTSRGLLHSKSKSQVSCRKWRDSVRRLRRANRACKWWRRSTMPEVHNARTPLSPDVPCGRSVGCPGQSRIRSAWICR